MIREFLDAVQGHGSHPETSAEDNIHSFSMVIGAVQSSDSKAVVQLG